MSLKNGVLDMNELAWFVSSRYGVNLSKYRESCLRRRIAHRLSVVGCESIDEYFVFINDHPEEIEKFMDTVTIHVTGFFRDHEVYEALERNFIPHILSGKLDAGHDKIRAWSAGCSTGEEAYSLAILLYHVIRKKSLPLYLEVFGTDLSEESIKTAMAGLYSKDQIDSVPTYMKGDSFDPRGELYKISRNIRRHVKFRAHDLFKQSPYSLLDLIMCRNVLIHFDHSVRYQISREFHQSLGEGGLLVLGKSEALAGDSDEGFELIDPRNKIYRKVETSSNA